MTNVKMIGLVGLIFAFSLTWGGCGSDSSAEVGTKLKEYEIKRGTFVSTVTANGIVIPIDRIEIKSKASGLIEELHVEVGDHVKTGDLIARLDQRDEQAAVGQARADYDIAQAELANAKRAYGRKAQLLC